MNLVIRQCTIDDLKLLREISYETYKETFEASNSYETMQAYLEEAFNLVKLKKELCNPYSTFYFLLDQETLVAYMKINLPSAQTDLNDSDSMELERIYVKGAYKGQGYGQRLVAYAISVSQKHGLKSVWLGVWEANSAAQKFYRKMGFEKVGEHGFRMGNEVQTDYIFKKLL